MVRSSYFNWLCQSIIDSDGRNNYGHLMEQLYSLYFSERTAKLIPNDANRIMDGLYLREEYVTKRRVRHTDGMFYPECTVLELIIGLAKRMDDSIGIKDHISWFWDLIANLGLTEFDDDSYEKDFDGVSMEVDRIISDLLERTYDRKGHGGLFPLQYPKTDQRKIEIWYQMSEYLNENYS